MSKEDIEIIWQRINCQVCYNKNINFCKEKCKYKCRAFKALENISNRTEELEQENKMFKEFYMACGSTDIAENITATRYAEIRREGYLEGCAERDKLAREICKECSKLKNNSISKDKIEELLENKFIVLYEGNHELSVLSTKIEGVKYIKAEHIEELLKDGGK